MSGHSKGREWVFASEDGRSSKFQERYQCALTTLLHVCVLSQYWIGLLQYRLFFGFMQYRSILIDCAAKHSNRFDSFVLDSVWQFCEMNWWWKYRRMRQVHVAGQLHGISPKKARTIEDEEQNIENIQIVEGRIVSCKASAFWLCRSSICASSRLRNNITRRLEAQLGLR